MDTISSATSPRIRLFRPSKYHQPSGSGDPSARGPSIHFDSSPRRHTDLPTIKIQDSRSPFRLVLLSRETILTPRILKLESTIRHLWSFSLASGLRAPSWHNTSVPRSRSATSFALYLSCVHRPLPCALVRIIFRRSCHVHPTAPGRVDMRRLERFEGERKRRKGCNAQVGRSSFRQHHRRLGQLFVYRSNGLIRILVVLATFKLHTPRTDGITPFRLSRSFAERGSGRAKPIVTFALPERGRFVRHTIDSPQRFLEAPVEVFPARFPLSTYLAVACK